MLKFNTVTLFYFTHNFCVTRIHPMCNTSRSSSWLRETFLKCHKLSLRRLNASMLQPVPCSESQFNTCFSSHRVTSRGGQFHRRPQACLDSDDTALSLRWTWLTLKTEECFLSVVASSCLVSRSMQKCWFFRHTSDWPGKRVVKDESVLSGISDFKFPLDRLFVRVTASQWDQDLWRAKHRHVRHL